MAKLFVVGNACVDLYVPPHQPPPPGGIAVVPPLDIQIGGNAANTAIVASRIGCSAAVAGVIGDDLFGRHVRSTLEAERVDVTRLRPVPGGGCPTTIVQNGPGGERSFVHSPGTNAQWSCPDTAVRSPCSVFHLAAPELLTGAWPGGVLDLVRRLKSERRTVSLDTFVFSGEADARAQAVRDHRALLEQVDLALPNEEEAVLLSGRREIRSVLNYFHECGVPVVAIKRGAKGAVVSWQGRVEEVPAERVRAVDTCGAGDSFVAGFLSAWIKGLDPLKCTRLGVALGTLCVQHRGALAGSADRKRLRRAIGAARLKCDSSGVPF